MLDLTPLRGLQISPAQLTGHASPRLALLWRDAIPMFCRKGFAGLVVFVDRRR